MPRPRPGIMQENRKFRSPIVKLEASKSMEVRCPYCMKLAMVAELTTGDKLDIKCSRCYRRYRLAVW